ncbi:MCE family protein [Nocardioides sp. TRM66260-LWL]|uniref:MCE family protein n=1 Tax=Nocardioides sp. TRM66260-LWL TaxID=2874478 RepID=UPI001CC39A64|nr:MCE family protein [Nocardioides sp. TRM66260-LWL]MBZ5735233.1 MCE family protein [Nocardioides sp. TRM66260-LWL]
MRFRNPLDRKTAGDLTRLGVFMLVTALATSLLVIVIGNFTFASASTYKAMFTDAAGVNKGDDVRIAGVKVGTVKDVRVADDGDRAEITFSVQNATELTQATHATIRYRNLVGQRYISLTQEGSDSGRLQPGSVIDTSKTRPALDLTMLFNGFKPLFQALSPDDINKLSYEVVQVFQGEGGTLEDLLRTTASVTNTLADRDQVITSLITNLDDVLSNLGDRSKQLSALIVNFRTLVAGLKADRRPILDSLDQISALAVQTADLVKGIRVPFTEDIKQLRRFADNLDRNRGEIDRGLQVLPNKLNKVGRTATYGSWFNFYLCAVPAVTLPGGLRVELGLPGSGGYKTNQPRCNLR